MFDRVFFDDDRVLFNLLANEEHYMPKPLYFRNLQSEIQPFMRKMVVDWMLEVRYSGEYCCVRGQSFKIVGTV